MQYRHPKAEEYAEIVKLSNVAYRADWRDGKTDEEIVATFKADHPDDSDVELANHFMAFTDDGKLAAKVSNNPFSAYLYGEEVKLGGIGGVATYAEYRRGGHVRVLMEMVLDALYKQEYTLSYLFPFSHFFYRKFGYETHVNVVHYNLNPSTYQLRAEAMLGSWSMLQGKSDPVWAEVKDLYRAFATGLNLTLSRDDDRWERYQEADPYAGQVITYLFRNLEGDPEAAFSFETTGDDSRTFKIMDLSFRSLDALAAILDFVRRFRTDYDVVSIPLPENYPLMNLLTEVPDIRPAHGMLRLIRVEKALALLPNPFRLKSTKILIHTNDQQLTANCGNYLLTFQSELEKPQVEKISDAASLENYDAYLDIDIRELGLLVAGSQSFAEMKDLAQITHKGDIRLLEALFPRRFNLQIEFY